MKKLAIVLGSIFAVLLVVAIAVPFMVDVDKFRPQIQTAVNDKINGELSLGKLSLSLLGGIKVRIESVALRLNGEQKPLVSSNSAYLEIPIFSLITMHPAVNVVLTDPKIDVVKLKNEKLNLMLLIKQTPAEKSPPPQDKGSSGSIPSIVAQASLGFRIENGALSYTDEVSNSKFLIDGLQLNAKDLGLAKTMHIDMTVPLKGKTANMHLDGPITAHVDLTPILSGGTVASASGKIDVDANQLALSMNDGSLRKSAKSPMNFKINFSGSENDIRVSQMEMKFNQLDVSANGTVTLKPVTAAKMDMALRGPGLSANLKANVQNFSAPTFDLALSGKEIDIDKLLPAEPEGKTTATKAAVVTHDEPNPFLSLAKNPTAANASGNMKINISRFVAKGAAISDFNAHARLKNLVLNIDGVTLKMFDGTLSAKADANLKTAGLNFSTQGEVNHLMVKEALKAFVPKYQNTLEGNASATWKLTGAAFPKSNLLKNLNGTVSLKAVEGKLHTVDLADSIRGIMSKVPLMSSMKPPNIDESFKSMRAEIKFDRGIIDANPMEVIGSDHSVDFKGKSRIMAASMTQETYIDVHDPHGLLPKEISGGPNDATLSLKVTGPLTSPKTDYGYTLGRLTKNVVKNQARDAISNQIKKSLGSDEAGKAVGDVLKGLGF